MGKQGELSLFDFIRALAVAVLLGLGMNPVFLILDVYYLWLLFVFAVSLIIGGMLMTNTKRYASYGLYLFALGLSWFILLTLLLCSFVTTPLYA